MCNKNDEMTTLAHHTACFHFLETCARVLRTLIIDCHDEFAINSFTFMTTTRKGFTDMQPMQFVTEEQRLRQRVMTF